MRVLILSLSIVGAVALNSSPRHLHNMQSEALVPDARLVRVLGAPVISMVTDLYWIRMISVATVARLPWQGKRLIQWGHFLTDLEPRFFWGYGLGGLLGTIDAGPQTYNVDEAAELLRKGIRNIPEDTRLYIYLAFLQLELQKDRRGAADTLAAAARQPSAPPFVGPLATRLYAAVGDFDAAKAFATAIAEQGDEETKHFFETRLLEIDQESVLQQVDAAAGAYAERTGHPAPDIAALVAEGLLPGTPVDPLGGSIILTPDGARATSREKRLRALEPPK